MLAVVLHQGSCVPFHGLKDVPGLHSLEAGKIGWSELVVKDLGEGHLQEALGPCLDRWLAVHVDCCRAAQLGSTVSWLAAAGWKVGTSNPAVLAD